MRLFLAYVMLTIFSFQVLPVKELGRLLFKAQLTEEIHEDLQEDDEMKLSTLSFVRLSGISYVERAVSFEQRQAVAIHTAGHIAHQHFPDIFAPPPNI
jgi:hypothetical protein